MTKPIELPAPAEPLRYVCNKCGSVGLGAGAAHQRSDGEQCAYMGVPYGPFWTAEQVRACAAAAIAAQAAEMEALRRWKSTNAPRLDALQGLLTAAQHEAHAGREAVASLASEREANALLTDEVEALRAALAELVALAELKAAIEMWVLDTVTGKQWPKMQPYEARMAACDDYAKRKPLAFAAARAALKEQTPRAQGEQQEPKL